MGSVKLHECSYLQLFGMTATRRVLLSIPVLICWILQFTTVRSAPIRATRETFARCQLGNWLGIPADCCPPKITNETIVDFCPPKRDISKPPRVRKAAQCLQGKELSDYTRKLQLGYELMRAVPDSDPRSYKRQYGIHCAECSLNGIFHSRRLHEPHH